MIPFFKKNKNHFLSFLCLVLLNVTVCARSLSVSDDVSEPATLDPHRQFSEKNHTILQQIYEGLVRFDPNGKIEPALAVSWERLSPLKVRFHLRKNVLFHNGDPLTSVDVKFSIERYLDPETKFPALGFISSLDHVEIIDDETLDIVTKYPDGLLLNRLAGFVLIVSHRYVIEHGDSILLTNPNGTGAFKFSSWKKGESISLVANTNYWMIGFPKIDRLDFNFMPLEKQIDALFQGKVDLVTELPGTMTLRVAENPKTKVIKKYTLNTVVGSMNTIQGPLRDLRIRKALNYAIDKDEVIRFDLLRNGRALATVTMDGEEGHNSILNPYPYDPQKAKDLLRDAGFRSGLVLDVIVKEQGRRTIGIIKEQLKHVGVELKITYTDDANIIRDINSKTWDMAFGNCSDPMVHSFFVQSVMFYSKSPFSIGRNAEYDKRLEEMVSTLDDKQRENLGAKLDSYIYDEALGLFTYQRLRTYGVSRNITFNPSLSGMPYFYSVSPGGTKSPVEFK